MSNSALRAVVIAGGTAYAPAIPYRMSVPGARDGAHRTYTGADAATVAALRIAPILAVKALEGRGSLHKYTHQAIRHRRRRNITTTRRDIGGDGCHVAGYILGVGGLYLSTNVVEHKIVVHHLNAIGIDDLQPATACLTASNIHPETRRYTAGVYHKKIIGVDVSRLEKMLDRRRHTARVRGRDYAYGIILPHLRRCIKRLVNAYDAAVSLSLRDVPRYGQRIPRGRETEYNHTAKVRIRPFFRKNKFYNPKNC